MKWLSAVLGDKIVASPRCVTRAVVTFAMALLVGLVPPQACAQAEYRNWVDASGNHSREAEFVGVEGDRVVLKTPAGKTLKVPLASLSEADQEFVREASDGRVGTSKSYRRLVSRHAPSPPFDRGLTAEQEAAGGELGARVAATFATKEGLDPVFDDQAFVSLAVDPVVLPSALLSKLAKASVASLKAKLAEYGQGNAPQFIHARRVDGELRLVFRRVDQQTLLPSYFELICVDPPAGKPLKDLVVPERGGRLSAWSRKMFLAKEPGVKVGRGMFRVTTGSTDVPDDALAVFRQAIEAYREPNYPKALMVLKTLPQAIWANEGCARFAIGVAEECDGGPKLRLDGGAVQGELIDAIDVAYPGHTFLAFRRFGELATRGRKEESAAFERAVKSMQQSLAGDPYLSYYAGTWNERQGNRPAAVEHYLTSAAMDRRFSWPHYAMVGIYLADGEYGRVVEVLELLESRFDIDARVKESRDPRWEGEWGRFESSNEGQRWKAAKRRGK